MKSLRLLLFSLFVAVSLCSFIPGTYAQFTSKTVSKNISFSTAKEFPDIKNCQEKNKIEIDRNNPKSLQFHLNCIDNKFKKLHYLLTYDTTQGTRGIEGTQEQLQGKYDSTTLTFASCSTGAVCLLDQNVHNIHLSIKLQEQDGKVTPLEEILP